MCAGFFVYQLHLNKAVFYQKNKKKGIYSKERCVRLLYKNIQFRIYKIAKTGGKLIIQK